MDEADWFNFISSGRPPEVAIGRLHDSLLKVLRADNARVVLRHDYALKCTYKHSLSFHQLPMMSITLDLGSALHDEARPNHLLFLHRDDVIFDRWYKLVVKLTGKAELYVTTFHRVDMVDVTRLVKGKRQIRSASQ